MADDNYFLCIIGAMERLWFRQMVLFSEEATTSAGPKLVDSLSPISEFPSSPSSFDSILSSPPSPDEETSTHESPTPGKQVSSGSILVSLQGDPNDEDEKKEQPTRLPNASDNRAWSLSATPSTQSHSRKFRTQDKRRLQKSMSCKTLAELELEEVKGFMDLGFVFQKENITPRMMSVVPGLQRIGIHPNEQSTRIIDASETGGDNGMEAKEEKKKIMRPYLSEAWLIKRPDSPLLNLKIAKVRSADDKKKLLRFWAQTVASEIHQ